MNVYLFRSKDVKSQLVSEVINVLIQVESPFSFVCMNHVAKFETDVLEWDQVFCEIEKMRKFNKIDQDDFCILLTSKQNEFNWFSAFENNGEKAIFVQTSELENYVTGNNQFVIAYEILANILQHFLTKYPYDDAEWAHEDPRGCMNDMCGWKADITFKIRTGDICNDCIEKLRMKNIDESIIQYCLKIFDIVRANSLHSREYKDIPYDDIKLPFPLAITRRKMNNTIEPLRKFLFLLDHFDSIIRTSVVLFGKIVCQKDFDYFVRDNLLHERPSLGHWFAAFKKLVNNQQSDLSQMPSDFEDRITRIAQLAESGDIIHIRNERRGHGYCDCHNGAYRNTYMECSPILDDFENILLPILIKFKLYFVFSAERISGHSFAIQTKILMGSHPDFVEEKITCNISQIDDIPLINHVYAYGNEKWIDLHPYVLYDECPACKHQRVLVTDGEKYIDPYIGHRVKIELN